MEIQALEFSAHPQGAIPVPVYLALDTVEGLTSLLETQSLRALLIDGVHLKRLRPFTDLVMDHGEKEGRKQLWRYFKRSRDHQVSIIEGDYKIAGQLRRSIGSLLKKAHTKNRSAVYIIGVADPAIFAQLWHAAAEAASAPIEMPSAPLISEYSQQKEKEAASLLEKFPAEPMPPELVNSYIGRSYQIQLVRALIVKAAHNDVPVLIEGESGTGKEIVARSIHRYGRGATPGGRFIPVNCSAISSELLESELFGHKRGAFTGAVDDHEGMWESADSGTLFLDEIGDLSLVHQAKILRALEDGEIRPVGANESINVDVRIIAATNRNLDSMVRNNHFREDLYDRLNMFPIRTPALRDHPEDIGALAARVWNGLSSGTGKQDLPPEVIAEFMSYRWPGNVRQLKGLLTYVHSVFGNDGARLDKINALSDYIGSRDGYHEPSPQGRQADQLAVHRFECIQHLRQVDEVVRSIKVALRPLVVDKTIDEAALQAVQSIILQRLDVLDALCMHPSLFGSAVAFDTAYHFKDKLNTFIECLATGQKEALHYYENEFRTHFTLVVNAILNETGALLKTN